jgi:trimeric autotransporter adhesin
MNRLYKLAWSSRTRSMVAVSELAKGRKKGTTLRGAIAAAVIGLTCGTASAATDTSVETCGENADESSVCVADSKQQLQTIITPDTGFIGPNGDGISIGSGTTAPIANADGDITIGSAGSVNSGISGNGSYGTALGNATTITALNGVAIGNNATVRTDGWNPTAVNATVVSGSDRNNFTPTASGDNSLVLGSTSALRAANATLIGASSLIDVAAVNSVLIGNNTTNSRPNSVALGNAGSAWQIVNMAAGTALNDAVNVSQLLPLVDALGDNARFDDTTGAIVAPSYSAQGSNDLSLAQAFTTLDAASARNALDITTLASQISDGGGFGLVRQAAAGDNLTVGASNDGAAVDFTGTDGTRALTGVTAGTLSGTSTEAVNGSQLNDTNSLLDARGTRLKAIEGSIDGFNGQLDAIQAGVNNAIAYDDASNGIVTLGGGANGTVITNVANGTIAAGSMDAINGSQLATMRDSFQNLIGGLDEQVGAIEDALKPVVDTDMGGSVVSNVGNATSNTELANIGQLNEYMQSAVDQAMGYTDAQIGATQQSLDNLKDQVNDRFKKQDERISRLGAMSAATNMMAFATQGIQTRNRGGVGVGTQNGFSAVSVGYSRALSENMNVSVSGTTSGSDTSAGIGFGMNW